MSVQALNFGGPCCRCMAQWSPRRKTEAYLNANAQFATPDSRQIPKAKRYGTNPMYITRVQYGSWSHPGDSKRTQCKQRKTRKIRKINHKNQWRMMTTLEECCPGREFCDAQGAFRNNTHHSFLSFSTSLSCSYMSVDILVCLQGSNTHLLHMGPVKTATTRHHFLNAFASLRQYGGTQSACGSNKQAVK